MPIPVKGLGAISLTQIEHAGSENRCTARGDARNPGVCLSHTPPITERSISMTEDRLMTIAEVADYLGLKMTTMYNWRRSGKGPRGIHVGSLVRYRRSDVDVWLGRHLDFEPRVKNTSR